MASRMDRYYKGEERSKKNQSLYEQINALGTYTNIEGVVDISNSNEINIENIKELIDQNNHKENKKIKYIDEEPELEKTTEKNYDLNDVLNQAKNHHSDNDVKHRNLKKRQYQALKKLQEEHPENEKIDELLNTLALGNSISDDLGIFDDLKSDTMVGEEAASIKKVLDDAKNSEEEESEIDTAEVTKTNLDDLDKSFYTASFNFSDKDFEDLSSNIEKNNKLIRIAIFVFSILIAIVLLVLIAKVMF